MQEFNDLIANIDFNALLASGTQLIANGSQDVAHAWMRNVWGVNPNGEGGYTQQSSWCNDNSWMPMCDSIVGNGWKLWSSECQLFCPTESYFSNDAIQSLNLELADMAGMSPEALALAQAGTAAAATVGLLTYGFNRLRNRSAAPVADEEKAPVVAPVADEEKAPVVAPVADINEAPDAKCIPKSPRDKAAYDVAIKDYSKTGDRATFEEFEGRGFKLGIA